MSQLSKKILGISAFFHDSAAALIVDGEIVAAAQEERFSRIKHDPGFPDQSISFCLKKANLGINDIDEIIYFEKPLLKLHRLMSNYVSVAPLGWDSFIQAIPLWIEKKIHIAREIDRSLKHCYEGPIYYCTHHESHASSAFFPSPYEEAAVMTFDGVGEWHTTTWGEGKGNQIQLHEEISYPHSLGLFYSAFTYYTGFKVNSGEYKLMGLAPYGQPKYKKQIYDNLIEVKEDGSFQLNLEYFNYHRGLTMTSKKFHELFGEEPRVIKPRKKILEKILGKSDDDKPLTQFHMDVAASVQKVIEEVIMKMVRHVYYKTGQRNLCLAGGVALNCVNNGKLLREGPFENIWIQPAAGDAGGALGAGLYSWYHIHKNPRRPLLGDSQKGSLLGPSFSQSEIEKVLDREQAVYDTFYEEDGLLEQVADLLNQGSIVGFFQGPMEFGPRALGCRSILGDARSEKMQRVMNLKIKYRESFRPFAASCLEERAQDYFEDIEQSPYMLMVSSVKKNRWLIGDSKNEIFGLNQINDPRSDIPAITHVDYSSRIQTVTEEKNPRFYRLLKKFEKVTGEGILVNTSFNVRGEPIVCDPMDAYRCFMGTDMDALVIEDCLLIKKNQKKNMDYKYKDQFELD